MTGTLLEVIFERHPCYDVILQQHLQHCSDADRANWNSYEQIIFGSVIDHSTVCYTQNNFLRRKIGAWQIPTHSGISPNSHSGLLAEMD